MGMVHKNGFERSIRSIQLEQVGFEACKVSHAFGPARREYYLFHYVVSGKGILEYNKKVVKINSHQLFLIMPGEVTYYQADALEPWTYCWFSMSGSEADLLVRIMGFEDGNRVVDYVATDEPLDAYIMELVVKRVEYESDKLMELSKLYELIALIRKNHELTKNHYLDVLDRNTHVRMAVDYLQKNYMLQISIQEITNYVGVDRTQLFRLFYHEFDMGPKAYLMQIRMDQARELLVNSNLTIKCIAFSVGYPDPYQFSKIFKRKYGVSPKSFRADHNSVQLEGKS